MPKSATASPRSNQGAATEADPTGSRRRTGFAERGANALGWFSVALGAVEIVAPDRFSRLIGIDDTTRNRRTVRAMGVRELSVVPGLFDRPRPGGFLAARVGGDLLDLGLLAAALGTGKNRRGRVGLAAMAVAGVTVLDLVASVAASRGNDPSSDDGAIRASGAVTINRAAAEVYAHWRDLEELPRFMAHLESVRDLGDGRSRWTAAAPAGRSVEWDAEMVEDRPGEVIAWRSVDDADVANHGSVRFAPAPGDRGTEVRVELEFRPPAGAVGAAVARMFGEAPHQQLADDLRRCKQVLEAGHVVRSDGAPGGTRTQRQVHQDDARPGN